MISVVGVIIFQNIDIYILEETKKLLLKGLLHIDVERVKFCLQGDFVPYVCLINADGVYKACKRQTGIRGFSRMGWPTRSCTPSEIQ